MEKAYNREYCSQKAGAKRRNIDWQFTYDSWMSWWGDDIIHRGKGSDKLVMARNGDLGPYSIDNCKKITHTENISEAQKGRPKPGNGVWMVGKCNNPNGRRGASL